MTNRTLVKSWIIFCLAWMPPADANDQMVGIGITLAKKTLINFGYQLMVGKTTWIRGRIYLASGGKPMALGLMAVKAEKTLTAWHPYLGLGLEVMPHRFRKKIFWTPYLCSSIGAGYCPHSNLNDQAELAIGYFPKVRKLAPMGISLWHFNNLQ
jgi:hypothetical protein